MRVTPTRIGAQSTNVRTGGAERPIIGVLSGHETGGKVSGDTGDVLGQDGFCWFK